MMSTVKFEFTSAGVDQWNDYFYALPPDEQASQAQLVQADIRQWLPASFYLDADQIRWLTTLDDTSIFVLGNHLSAAMALQLPIRLVKPDKPGDHVGVLGVKRGEAHNPVRYSVSVEEPPQAAEGEFVFTITY